MLSAMKLTTSVDDIDVRLGEEASVVCNEVLAIPPLATRLGRVDFEHSVESKRCS